MRVPLKWLKEYVDVDISPEDLAEKLTMHGVEVVAIEFHGKGLDKVVVGKIKAMDEHAKEEGVFVCRVDIGSRLIQVLTDATNIKVGDKVPIALEGGTVAKEISIRRMELHGVESFGMLCKPHHLGLPESTEVMKMPLDASLGKDVKKVIGLGGYVIDIDILPNRGDCLSLRGVAREVSAVLGKKLKNKKTPKKISKKGDFPKVDVQILDKKACPRYTAKVIKNVKIGPSPEWLRNRLLLCGIRPISNVVDVTNYILLEYGQPMHAFDLDLVAGHKIMVRSARRGETIKTIDGTQLKLDEKSLVIADANQAVALAGIMGSENSEVNDGTHTVLLESAYFDPISVYRTSRKMKIRSESSIRFEKGVDYDAVKEALEVGAALIAEVAGGVVAPKTIDVLGNKLKPKKITLRLDQVKCVIGREISFKDVKKILELLGLQFVAGTKRTRELKFIVPSARARDLEREIDLIEEIVRIYGYDRIQNELPNTAFDRKQHNYFDEFVENIRNELVAAGLYEIKTFSMISQKDYDKLNVPVDSAARRVPELANPLNEYEAWLRNTLLPGLLKVTAHNQNWRIPEVALFELDKVFLGEDNQGSHEDVTLGIALTKAPLQSTWAKVDKQPLDFYVLKGLLERVLKVAQAKEYEIQPLKHRCLQPGLAAVVRVENNEIGYLGKLHPNISANFDIKKPCYVLEINLSKLFKHARQQNKYIPLTKYPSIARDIAMVVSADTSYAAVQAIVLSEAKALVERIELFDFYTGKPVPSGHYSIAMRIIYRDRKKTLSDEEINQLHQKVLNKLKQELKVEIRM